jgi:hypothetical protein
MDTLPRSLMTAKAPEALGDPNLYNEQGQCSITSSRSHEGNEIARPDILGIQIEEEAFEDAIPQLPEPSSPPAIPNSPSVAQGSFQGRNPDPAEVPATSVTPLSVQALGSGSIRALRAAARLHMTSTTQATSVPSPLQSWSMYDL